MLSSPELPIDVELAQRHRSSGFPLVAILVVSALLPAGCSIFDPRDPEPPVEGSGTYLQPDTPAQVVSNIQAAIEELNTLNYRRSFADDFAFQPSASAQARYQIWAEWDPTNEEQYFSALSAAAEFGEDHRLELTDPAPVPVSERVSIVDSSYMLAVDHNRSDQPTEVQGRLRWEISQGEDGLWRLTAWVDQEFSNTPAWSDLKAAFLN
jgi:hypothetical protein